MANHKSAKKRTLQTLKKTLVNKNRLSRARSAARALRKAVAEGGASAESLASQISHVQSLWARTHLSPRTIARKTSRLAKLAGS